MESLPEARVALLATRLEAAFQHKIEHPDDKTDPSFALYGAAVLEEMAENPDARNQLVDILDKRTANSAHYLANIGLRIINLDRLVAGEPGYYRKYDTVDKWRKLVRRTLIEEGDIYHMHWYRKDLPSNLYYRYVNSKVLASIHQGRIGRQPTNIDLGSSLSHGPKAWVRNEDYPFLPFYVLESDYDSNAISRRRDDRRTAAINADHIQRDFKPGPSVGVDIEPSHNPETILYAKASSSYPKELADQRRQELFDNLCLDLEGVTSVVADYTSLEDLQRVLKGKADIVSFYFTLYQNNPADIEKALKNAEKFAEHFVIIFDSVDVDPLDPNQLRFYNRLRSTRRPYGIRLLVKDMRDPEAGFQEYWRFNSGRPHRMIPNLGNAAVAGAFDI